MTSKSKPGAEGTTPGEKHEASQLDTGQLVHAGLAPAVANGVSGKHHTRELVDCQVPPSWRLVRVAQKIKGVSSTQKNILLYALDHSPNIRVHLSTVGHACDVTSRCVSQAFRLWTSKGVLVSVGPSNGGRNRARHFTPNALRLANLVCESNSLENLEQISRFLFRNLERGFQKPRTGSARNLERGFQGIEQSKEQNQNRETRTEKPERAGNSFENHASSASGNVLKNKPAPSRPEWCSRLKDLLVRAELPTEIHPSDMASLDRLAAERGPDAPLALFDKWLARRQEVCGKPAAGLRKPVMLFLREAEQVDALPEPMRDPQTGNPVFLWHTDGTLSAVGSPAEVVGRNMPMERLKDQTLVFQSHGDYVEYLGYGQYGDRAPARFADASGEDDGDVF